jgi:ATP-dependent exoDNAse (exonuclease V) alpha subunit
MENTDGHIFITGKAGTGKSTLIQYFKENTRKKVAYLAPTGVAALNIDGQTIHSFFGLNPKLGAIQCKDIETRMRLGEKMRYLDTIVIDEISMVRSDILDAVNWSLKKNIRRHSPFGGVQVILIGDPFQLPPIVGRDKDVLINDDEPPIKASDYFDKNYPEGTYFFNAHVFNPDDFHYIELQRIFRQNDMLFINILNAVRKNTLQNSDLDMLNQRCYSCPDPDTVTLATLNDYADKKNQEELKKLTMPERIYPALLNGVFKPPMYPTAENLILKIGAQVMMIKNDMGKEYVNGSIGIVTELKEDFVSVKIKEREVTVFKETWENIKYEYDKEMGKFGPVIKGTFTQFPIMLAWAFSIHKSQGKTFDKVHIDLCYGTWDPGHLYVALSRCKTLKGITLEREIKPSDIKNDPRIVNFIKRMQNLQAL